VLEPLLFSLYISGFREVLSFRDYNINVNDIQISLSCHPKDIADGVARINEDIERMVEWAEGLGLLLNESKTRAIIVGTSRYVNSLNLDETPPIRVNGTAVPYLHNVEYLGKTITSNLTWTLDIGRTCRRVYGVLHQLKTAKHLLPLDIRKKLISFLALPLFDYCCVAMLDITKEAELLLQRSLNSCVRFIVGSRRHEHITPHFVRLRWLKLHERRLFFTGCLLYRIHLNQF